MNVWGATSSPKRLARVAGCLYGLVVIFGGFTQGFVYPRVYAAGHAATTAAHSVREVGESPVSSAQASKPTRPPAGSVTAGVWQLPGGVASASSPDRRERG